MSQKLCTWGRQREVQVLKYKPRRSLKHQGDSVMEYCSEEERLVSTLNTWASENLKPRSRVWVHEYKLLKGNLGNKRLLQLLLLSHFSRVRFCVTPETAAHQAPYPWDSPSKNTGVGCHFLLQCMNVKRESEVTQSCPTFRDPMDCSPGSSIHRIFQSRVLEWVSIAFSNL